MSKWVYNFGDGEAEGSAAMPELLGGKGANLAEMSNLGLPVPPGFTISTEVCTAYFEQGHKYPGGLEAQLDAALSGIERSVGMKFGDPARPLLVSVRSGGRASMPGMMDTVLNLGLNDETVEGLAAISGNRAFAYDSYRRFLQMYSDVVLGLEHHHFEELLEDHKAGKGVTLDTELGADDWLALAHAFKDYVAEERGEPFPQDVREQLWGAVGAVFGSWMNQRAVTYRRLHNIPESWGTAVNVQAMVFGNMGETSATGVAFTRDPSTGEKIFYGEFLINAPGRGRRRRDPYAATSDGGGQGAQRLRRAGHGRGDARGVRRIGARLPHAWNRTTAICRTSNSRCRKASCGCCRRATASARRRRPLKIAVNMVEEGLIDRREALLRIDPASLDQLLHPTLDPDSPRDVLTRGLPASPGAASGRVVFSSDEAESLAASGERVILVRVETSPEDIHGMHAAAGILTSRGGMTSHAAVVARGMGRPCVSGAGTIP